MRIVPLAPELHGAWDAFAAWHPAAWWWHTTAWLEYCLAYRPGAVDRSFAVQDARGGIAGIAPLVREGDAYAMGGAPCPFSVSVDPSAAKLANDETLRRADADGVRTAALRSTPVAPAALFEPDDACAVVLRPGWENASFRSRVVDLTAPVAALWAAVRKSYRSLIHRAERTHVIGATNADAYEALHRRVHGGRPAATYAAQARWVTAGHALVLAAWRPDGTADGAAYWIVWKGAAYYASAAYAEPDLAHAIVWRSLLALRDCGIARAELGWQGHATDDKGRSVEFFKTGFGGEDVPVFVAERHVPSQEAATA